MAGLLLSKHNILILDEPGNHLDVDTIESLADALVAYEGTLIFTSHDRHFLKRVASSIIEVRDGRVINYRGQYETYLAKVEEEIEAGERELATERKALPPEVLKAIAQSARPTVRSEKEVRKELKTVEKSIAQLDAQKKTLTAQFLESTNDNVSKKLDGELAAVTARSSRKPRIAGANSGKKPKRWREGAQYSSYICSPPWAGLPTSRRPCTSMVKSRCSSGIWPMRTGTSSGTSITSMLQVRPWIVSRAVS